MTTFAVVLVSLLVLICTLSFVRHVAIDKE